MKQQVFNNPCVLFLVSLRRTQTSMLSPIQPTASTTAIAPAATKSFIASIPPLQGSELEYPTFPNAEENQKEENLQTDANWEAQDGYAEQMSEGGGGGGGGGNQMNNAAMMMMQQQQMMQPQQQQQQLQQQTMLQQRQ